MKNIWVEAARPRTLPLALASILMGSFLAASQQQFSWAIFLLSSLTTVFLQILSNFANDYGDTQNGADLVGRVGPQRAVQSGKIMPKTMLKAIFLISFLSLASGTLLLFVAFQHFSLHDFWPFLGLGLLAIVAAVTYTAGKKPYGYAGLGDVSVVVFFGFIGVLGSMYLHTHSLAFYALFPAMSCGCFAVAVLNINNIRDIETDHLAGKYTIPVRIGRKKAVIYQYLLLITGLFCAISYTILQFGSYLQYIFMLVCPLLYHIGVGVAIAKTPQQTDTFLKKMALTSLLFTLLFGLGLLASKF